MERKRTMVLRMERLLTIAIATALLVVAMLLLVDVAAAEVASDVREMLTKHMSTKTKYPEPTHAEELEMRAHEDAHAAALQCRPVQLNFVVRHGTRFPTIKDIRRISSTHDKLLRFQRDGSGSDATWIRDWVNPYRDDQAGWLAPAGVDELAAMGRRLRERFGAHFTRHGDNTKFVFDSTWKVRTQQSASAFAFGFFNDTHQPVHVGIAAIGADRALRFFDNCPAYDRAIDANATATQHHADFRTGATMQTTLRAFRDLGGGTFAQDEPLTIKDLEAAYAACSFDVAVRGVYDEWCALLTRDALAALDYFHDLKHFYKKSHGHALAFAIAAPLLQDVMASMRARIDNASTIEGHFRFAHAETILPLAALLDLTPFDRVASDRAGHFLATTPLAVAETRAFRGSVLAPFAANIGFVLYECHGDSEESEASDQATYRVATLLHERPVALRECHGEELCPFATFERIYRRWTHEFDFESQCA